MDLGFNNFIYFNKTYPKVNNFSVDLVNKYGFYYKDRLYTPYTSLSMKKSAFVELTRVQKTYLYPLLFLFLVLLLVNWHATLIGVLGFITLIYFFDLLFNFFLVTKGLIKNPQITISSYELDNLADWELPEYTIFCPLYKEWQVLDQFMTAINNLDYPKNKLQVLLLLEEDDKETIQQAFKFNLPSYFEIVIVPTAFPKTKPKACNYGLIFARGEYCVIYDAEDIPEPAQLKKAFLGFKNLGPGYACIQAKLNFYNPSQNLLTRLFTTEYTLWFNLILAGLQSIDAPIPLGGTSNHFPTEILTKLGGWDPFNVTEDADLGIRIAKMGYKTALIDSTTMEEANSELKNWFFQRTRWIKGYFQTYFVHMRDFKDLFFRRGIWSFLVFQLWIGGKGLAMLINPLMWMVTISYYLFRPQIGHIIETFFPTPILYLGVFSLVLGNFTYLYFYMVGCLIKKQYYLIKYIFLIPVYWLGLSLASWVGLINLIINPHYWFKTKHGLHLKQKTKSPHLLIN